MTAFSFIVSVNGGAYSAKCHSKDELTADAGSQWELEKTLKQMAVENSEDTGAVQCSFTMVTPKKAIFFVNVGGGPVIAVAGAPAAGGDAGAAGGAAAAQAAPAEEEEEEEEDEDMGFSLFD